jgi:hypothetical protein
MVNKKSLATFVRTLGNQVIAGFKHFLNNVKIGGDLIYDPDPLGSTATNLLTVDAQGVVRKATSLAGVTGTVTSVAITAPSAFTVTGSPITSSGTIAIGAAGTAAQYVRGDGQLGDFPTSSGGGSSVSYYLNGSVNQGTLGGNVYRELNKTPIIGAGTDFTIAADGYIAQFITDANDPSLLEIPGGNWNFEFYFSSSSSGGTPSFYVELSKYNGTTFTPIANNSAFPEFIAFGTTVSAYFGALAVPQTTLAVTDRLAIRVYVIHSGRTITLHTENGHLCQVITTFSTGLNALNGLTKQVQYFATGSSGTDFNISSISDTHRFNIPTASGTNRGLLSSSNWTNFTAAYNDKINSAAVTGTTTKTLTLTQQDGGTITASWTDINTNVVTSVFGRTGAVVATSGDYTTAQVTESGNLYFTNARGIGSTLTGYASSAGVISSADTILSAIQKLNGNIGALITGVSSVNGLSGAVTLTTTNIAEGTNLYYTNTRTRLALSAGAGISYNNTTGVVSSTITQYTDALARASISAGTGISYNSTTGVITNSLPDQTVIITAGSGISVSGSYPSFTVASTITQYTNALARAAISLTTTGTSGAATYNNTTGVLNIPQYQSVLTNPVTGTGTTNYVSKFTGTSTVGNSQIFDNGTNVGIGTTSPLRLLHVAGFAYFDTDIFGAVNNGIFFSGDGSYGSGVHGRNSGNDLVLQSGGSEQMRIISTGNVGIGTTSPTAKLQVAKGAQSNTVSIANSAAYIYGADVGLAIGQDNGAGGYGTWVQSARLSDGVSFSMALNPNGGNVGIGTISPSVKLHVVGGTALIKSNVNNGSPILTIHTNDDLGYTFSRSNTSGFLEFDGNQTGFIGYVFKNGNVGIGTTNPVSLLNLNNGDAFINVSDTIRGLQFGYAGPTHGSYRAAVMGGAESYGGTDSGMLTFHTQNGYVVSAIPPERMRITSAGNVGIGTTSPGAKLDVTGTIRQSSVISSLLKTNASGDLVAATAGTDYQAVLTNPVTGTGTATRIAYWSGTNTITSTSNLYWDNTNARLGIGTTAPSAKVHLVEGNFVTRFLVGQSTFTGYNSGLTAGQKGNIIVGQANSTNNAYVINFIYQSSGSTSNSIGLGFFNNDDIVTISANKNVAIATTPTTGYTLTVGSIVGGTGTVLTKGSVKIETGALGVGVNASATAGRIDASNDIVPFSSSDLRLKENIKNITDPIDKIKRLNGVEFDWIKELEQSHGYSGHDTGIIAQEVQDILPMAVRTNASGYLAVRYEKLIGLLIEAVKEQQVQIDYLNSKLN